jgi:hypothetical protein
MVDDVTRHIRREVERELWARSAGRCQFQGCNRLLYKSPVTQERVNLSEKAHIYSFAKNGPRGWGPFVTNRKEINDLVNLLLVCHDCHETIDQDKKGDRYPASLLIDWKRAHETRVRVVTGISPNKKSHVILYGGKIGEEDSTLQPELAVEAMFPDWYPTEESPLGLSMSCEHEDVTPLFWQTEEAHLQAVFERQVRPLIRAAKPNHFSIFARANQPLLVLLGALLTDKTPAEVYQLRREPITWKWESGAVGSQFQVIRPEKVGPKPALVISLSGRIHLDRVTSVVGSDASLWELTVDSGHNDFLKYRSQLSSFRETVRKLMVDIANTHGQSTPLKIFPAMPVACAVEFGRVRMPKADMPWIMFDQNNKLGTFVEALHIGGKHEHR